FLEAPRCIALIVARGTGEAVDLLLELGDLLHLLFLLLDQPARLFRALCARHALKTVHTLGDRALLACELLRAVECLLCLLFQRFTLAPLQPPARLFQFVQCGVRVRRVAAARIRRAPPHLVRGLLHLTRDFGEARLLRFTRQPLQLPRRLLRLLSQLTLTLRTAAATLLVLPHRRLLAQSLVLLLLATCKLTQPLERGIDFVLVLCLLLFAALHRFVLVAQLVTLQLEQVGQILRVRRPAATTAAAALLLIERDLHLAEQRLGTLQLLERPLLGAER